jgi:SAM-dependent methyltransferase
MSTWKSGGELSAQNIYDDPEFLAGYVTLDRQVHGLDGAAEWPTLRSMLPEMAGRRVVDLGCGFGWFSRWADEHGATSVLGVDGSTKMLERARSETAGATVEYQCADLDLLDLEPGSADVVFSSLAAHYVRDLSRLMSMVGEALASGGSFVFSVEHPIYSAPTTQRFETSEAGDRVWPLDNYAQAPSSTSASPAVAVSGRKAGREIVGPRVTVAPRWKASAEG